MSNADANFDDIKKRLDEIADRVSQEGIDLDEALSLYEEAVKLGIAACDVSEIDADAEQVEGDAACEAVAESASGEEAVEGEGVPVFEVAEAVEVDASPVQEEGQ